MKKTRRILKTVDITEYKSFETYLERKALKGWMLVKLGNGIMTFEKSTPRVLKFNVSLLDQNSLFELPDEEVTGDYRRLCEDAGWTYCTGNALYQVFYSESGEAPLPIHTDSAIEYKLVRDTMVKSFKGNLFLLAIYMFIAIMNFSRFDYETLLSNSGIFSIFWPTMILVLWIFLTAHNIAWLIRNRVRARENEPLLYASNRQVKARKVVIWGLMAVYFFLLILSFVDLPLNLWQISIILITILLPAGVGILVINKIRPKNWPRKKKIMAVSGVLLFVMVLGMSLSTLMLASGLYRFDRSAIDDIDSPLQEHVLTLADFGMKDPPQRVSAHEQKSVFSPGNLSYSESYGRDSKDYKVGYVRTFYIEGSSTRIASYLFNSLMSERFEENEAIAQEYLEYGEPDGAVKQRNIIQTVDLQVWGANRGYYLNSNRSEVVLLKDDIVAVFSGDLDFSDQQVIDICREKLGF